MRKIGSAATLAACGLMAFGAIGGCSTGGDSAPESKPANQSDTGTGAGGASGEKMNIEVVSKGFQVDFWKMVNAGAQEAGKDYDANVNFVGPASEANISEQIEQLNNALNKKPNAVAFAPLDQEASMDLIAQAASMGIPLVTFDANIEADTGGAVKAFVATDNVAAGGEAADRMYEKIKDKLSNPADTVRIAVMAQDTTSKSVAQRTGGFIDHMVELIGADKVSVIGHDMYAAPMDGAKIIIDVGIPAETTDAAGNTTAQTLLNNADLAGFYGSNEFSAKAMI
ncbi:MAG: substrate-binding domain-containing protein, partial [Scrofimicrobium sp.]